MRTLWATAIVGETGDVQSITIGDSSTYESHHLLSTYGSPYLGSYETSEDWRRALGAYLTDTVAEFYKARGCHGDRLVYVSKGCHVYVFEIDFDEVQS